MGVKARVMTFEPHPRVLFQPGVAPFRLTPAHAKIRLLADYGIHDVVVLPFNQTLAHLPAQEFVERVLHHELDAQHIVAGHDFVFGHNRNGDMKALAAWLEPKRVGVTEIAPLGDGTVFSSTRIRELLKLGDPKAAAVILGREWSIVGTVMKGAQRGRTIGVPTANIQLGDYLRPKFGVYAIRAGRIGEPLIHRGVANIGVRPTVDGQSENLEAHLFDFDSDIYDQVWEFALTDFIRAERKFEDINTLKTQIMQDITAARLAL